MKLKQLESYLSSVIPFEEPQFELEQYPTSAHLASRMIFTAANSYDDIVDKNVLDLGCGTGILGIASVMVGAGHVVGVDVDEGALGTGLQNLGHLEVEEEMELVHCNVAHLQFRPGSFDTVVMNPPFGTRVAGADTMFLQKAFEVATTAVYSLHKTSTREYLLKKSEEWGFQGEVLAELRFDVPQMYKFHKKKSVDIQVDLIRFQRIT
mmetsp:Transcript_35206/g.44868  ORF Transcript_35206/g.44868 Transcript_35206/m.44868 type:complete len:208 (-) Transcript_35206:270-893(-)|eukprot:CAMPEP_0117749416 /NCGR_PEP_ID=MMETSP0947-20121206/9719_1 /TAXON_ID=44440 /ORGANISM="Chattonella subsalsa, Strain CCMP2191" /LENGTH=207 /DNA_ID=CAMNT_0005567307 /DNA_START=171 /DNA_END=794 /DNA_ORIENTATION=+